MAEKYVVIVKSMEHGEVDETTFSAETLGIAVDVVDSHVHVFASQSYPTFREGELISVAIMTATEFKANFPNRETDIAAEDCGYLDSTAIQTVIADGAEDDEGFIEIPNELFKDAVFEDGTSVLAYIEESQK